MPQGSTRRSRNEGLKKVSETLVDIYHPKPPQKMLIHTPTLCTGDTIMIGTLDFDYSGSSNVYAAANMMEYAREHYDDPDAPDA